MKQWKIFAAFAIVFVVAYGLPLSSPKVTAAILEAFKMLQWLQVAQPGVRNLGKPKVQSFQFGHAFEVF